MATPAPAFSGAQERTQLLRNPCILGNPQRQAWAENQKWLPHPCILGGPKESGIATEPLHSRGSQTPSSGTKIRSGYLTPAFSGAQKRAELLRNPCILGNPKRQARGQHQKWLPHPRILRGPKRGRNCYITPALSGIPIAKLGDKIRSGFLTLAFPGAQKRAELLRNLCILGDPQRQAREENQKWLPHPCLPWGPKEGGIAT